MALGVVDIERVIRRVLDTDPATCDLSAATGRLDDLRRIDGYFAARAAAFRSSYERLLVETAATPPGDRTPPGSPSSLSSPEPDSERAVEPEPRLPPWSTREARRQELRAKWLVRCRSFAEALSDGRVSPDLVDALASVLDRLEPTVVAHLLADEPRMLRLAVASTPEGLRHTLRHLVDEARCDLGEQALDRQRRSSHASTRITDEGMYRLWVELDPERGPAVFDAIRQRMGQLRGRPDGERRTEADLRLQAVIELIAGTATVVPEVLVVVDERTAREGPHPQSTCETEAGVSLPASIGVDLCARAKVTAAIVAADGRVVAQGCASRTASREQRRALRAMYRSCAHPDCDRPFTECQMHHVIHWEHGGPTSIPNLVPLCGVHHHLVHEGGWALTIDAQRTLRWHRPGGELDRVTPLAPLLERPHLRAVGDRSPTDDGSDQDPPSGRAPPRQLDPDAA